MVDDAYWHVLPGLLDRKPQVAVVGDDHGLALPGEPQDRKWLLTCGAKGTRTPGLLDANQTLFQLSYSPEMSSRQGYLVGPHT